MLMYCIAKTADELIAKSGRQDIIYLNINSLAERYNRIKLNLLPPNSLGANTEKDFDIKYMEWIFSNNAIFISFMSILVHLYNGYDVFLIITDEGWSDMLVESLLKLIQQRYGINAVSIKSLEDLQYAEDSIFEPYGLVNLDQDLERYTYLMAIAGGIKDEN